MNSIERMANVNSLIDENSAVYWESLMTGNCSFLDLMLPLKDSEEILIFSNRSILQFNGLRYRNPVIFNTRARSTQEIISKDLVSESDEIIFPFNQFKISCDVVGTGSKVTLSISGRLFPMETDLLSCTVPPRSSTAVAVQVKISKSGAFSAVNKRNSVSFSTVSELFVHS